MNKILTAIIVIIALVYVLSPIDFIPDIIPIIGWIDDIVVAIGAYYLIFKR